MLYIKPGDYLTLAKFPPWRLTVATAGRFPEALLPAPGGHGTYSQGGLLWGLLGREEGNEGRLEE